MTQLRQIMLEELERRNYTQSTIRAYIRIIEHYSRHFHRSPEQLGQIILARNLTDNACRPPKEIARSAGHSRVSNRQARGPGGSTTRANEQVGQPGSPTKIMNDGSVTFSWFVENRFLPLKGAAWKKEQPRRRRFSFNAISSSLSERDSVSQLRQVQLAASSQQTGHNTIQGQSAADACLPSGHLCRGSRSGLPFKRPCAQSEGPNATARDRHDDSDIGSAPPRSFRTRPARLHFT